MNQDGLTVENINTTKLLGVALKRLRKQRSMSQDELAKGTGIRQATISDIENGRSGTLETFFKMVQFLEGNLAISSERNIAGKKISKSSKAEFLLNMMDKN